MTHNNTLRYLDKLQDIVKGYNNSYHRSIQTTPAQVTKANEDIVWSTLYNKPIGVHPNFSKFYTRKNLRVGDTVRLSKTKLTFEKGYRPNWTEELFTISERIPRRPYPVYKVIDLMGDRVEGTFYAVELLPVAPKSDETFKVEKIIRQKKVGGVKHYLIKWLNYPPKFNSWVPEGDMVSV